MDTKARPQVVWLLVLLAAVMATPATAAAQAYENVGIRAQGMGGAFVAVADDATATWWNPAGLAHGAWDFNTILEVDTTRRPDAERDPSGIPMPASESHVRAFVIAFPALGLSYYRLTVSEIQPINSTGPGAADRQDMGAGEVRLRSLKLSQFGVTVGQSVGEHLVLGSTVKLIHGSLGAATTAAAGASLDDADSLDGAGETHADLDLGAMVIFGPARLGLTVKNVSTPAFGVGDDRLELGRRARAGFAIVDGRVVMAADLDLTTAPTVSGDERRVAAGIEAWSHGRRLGIRGGVNANTLGPARPSASGGISLALRSGVFLDGQRTVGGVAANQGWGIALRMTLF